MSGYVYLMSDNRQGLPDVQFGFGNNVVFDAHFGWVRMDSNVAQSDVGENKGLDWLGIPGTNGPVLDLVVGAGEREAETAHPRRHAG
mgnify:CR=1 FL=1